MLTFPLHTGWRFRDTSNRLWHSARVPGCVHTDLLRAGRIPDPFHGTNELDLQWIEERGWEYRATFVLPPTWRQQQVVELAADGLDTAATIYLNGRKLAATDNMFIRHRWAVTPHLRPGRNELRIVFRSALDYIRQTRRGFSPPREASDPVGNSVRIRKQQCQFGWDWGPRLVTAGIWRDLRLEGWSQNRLADVRITQHHSRRGVELEVAPRFARAARGTSCRYVLTLDGCEVFNGSTPRFAVPEARLWWPAGQGAQPLYILTVIATNAAGAEIDRLTRRIGLRTIKLERTPDRWGECFRFVVNGRPVFFKGANWIPAHCFPAGLTREDYARDLRAAAAAHMNGLRVWGGGIYESEDFYDLCDELGLMVWQDFMFACTLYPSDRAFAASVRTEAEQQVTRLRHRACLALWCGNNEVAQLNLDHLRKVAVLRCGYRRIFHDVLPAAVAACDGITAYWPSSEWRGALAAGHAWGEKRGDTHYWDVWHLREPVKSYEKWRFRFCSEFGMQSYSSPATNTTFCPANDRNVFGPAMENHQKNRAGNQIILDYVGRRYRFPRSQAGLIYLSQLNQAHCLQVAVEHFRRQMPRCMGAIYWQLNDCWPVASWSSLEFTGRWKALHHAARRFNAPALASAHVAGDETAILGNYRRSTVDGAELYTVYDAPAPAAGILHWEVRHFDGRKLLTGHKAVELQPGASRRQKKLALRPLLARHGRDQVYLRLALEIAGECVSENSVFFAPPRFLQFPRGKTTCSLRLRSATEAELTFRSTVFQHAFVFDFPGVAFAAGDNFFELYPGRLKTVTVRFTQKMSAPVLRQSITWQSLVDTYE